MGSRLSRLSAQVGQKETGDFLRRSQRRPHRDRSRQPENKPTQRGFHRRRARQLQLAASEWFCGYVSRIRKGPKPLQLVESDGQLPRPEYRMASRLFCRKRALAARAETRIYSTGRDGERSLSRGARAEVN